MSFIVATEKRHWRTRVLYAGMYAVAILGAASMVYPFLLMVSGSVKSQVDFDDYEVIPKFLRDDEVLYRKFAQARYNANQGYWQLTHGSMLQTWEEIPYPQDVNDRACADVEEFIASEQCPQHMLGLGQKSEAGGQPLNLRRWRDFLADRFEGDIIAMNRALGTDFQKWDDVIVPEPALFYRGNRFATDSSAFAKLYATEFRPKLPRSEFFPISANAGFYCQLWNSCGGDVAKLNAAHGTTFKSLEEIPLPRAHPAGQPHAPLWKNFIQDENGGLNVAYLRLRPSARDAYRALLQKRYPKIADYNRAYGTNHASFDQIEVPQSAPDTFAGYNDYQRFVETDDSLPHVEIDSFEYRWRDFLKQKYGTIDACATAHGRTYASFDTIPFNPAEYDAWLMLKHRGAIVREFLKRNYVHVLDFLVKRGNALKVTALYVGLTVVLHLLINPLAAYALSRYKLSIGHWILLFCVLTMAFPAEVGSIPRFLLIRELGMLNTIWALVLPGVAHGFSIFILKSFFDGLPQELYEASLIEGASESWMFRNVTLSLTKPILAVTAFGAFVSAYGAFMFALVIAPDERMWTISVWLYQFQQRVTDPVRFASLVVASIPVLLAFLLMQRFILRGIVLPVER